MSAIPPKAHMDQRHVVISAKGQVGKIESNFTRTWMSCRLGGLRERRVQIRGFF
jgi:hypothetical protein